MKKLPPVVHPLDVLVESSSITILAAHLGLIDEFPATNPTTSGHPGFVLITNPRCILLLPWSQTAVVRQGGGEKTEYNPKLMGNETGEMSTYRVREHNNVNITDSGTLCIPGRVCLVSRYSLVLTLMLAWGSKSSFIPFVYDGD